MSRHLEVIFCEDIRHEISGLRSMIGVMSESITLPAPSVMPKLCISAQVVADAADAVESLRILVKHNGNLRAEHKVTPEELVIQPGRATHRWQRVGYEFGFYQVELNEEGVISVVAQTEREVLIASPLHILIDSAGAVAKVV